MLAGVIDSRALPGSPRAALTAEECAEAAARDARVLAGAGYDAIVVENFGDAPFFATRVPASTVAAINVLRNDAESALSIAICTAPRPRAAPRPSRCRPRARDRTP